MKNAVHIVSSKEFVNNVYKTNQASDGIGTAVEYGSNEMIYSVNYDNIIASCKGYKGNTCGPHKDNDYEEERFISPLTEGCEECFSYTPNGEIEGDKYTIELLHLDSYELNQARKATYKWLLNMDVRDIERYYLCFLQVLFGQRGYFYFTINTGTLPS